ncbi:hypothetical protein OE88DRAFT_1630660, partial [Heliocybe sulcata]
SIEILPGGLKEWEPYLSSRGPFLYQEGNLGVPQKILYQAYLACVPRMKRSRSSRTTLDQTRALDLVHLTSVTLLANPAHYTALRQRKSLIEMSVLEAGKELQFMDALLSVREACKQSVLWCYRRWLLRRIYGGTSASHNNADDGFSQILLPLEAIQKELAVVSRACEIYPRNYFAWLHRHHCASVLVSSCGASTGDHCKAFVGSLLEEFRWARHWLELHVTDYSAADYLVKLPERVSAITMDDEPSYAALKREVDSLLAHSLSLAQSYPDHETVWMYMRLTLGQIRSSSSHNDDIRKFAVSIACAPSEGSVNDGRSVASNARRFLDWMDRQTGHPQTWSWIV